jgi:hypothetical protein
LQREENMRRPKLIAFHVAMTLTYPVIIWAYAAGWTRLGWAVWTADLATCLAILLACAAILVAAWGSSGRPVPFLGWLRRQFEKWRAGAANGAAPLSAEELSPEPTGLEAVARMGEAAGRQPGSGTPDGEPVRALPSAHRPDGRPLPVDRLRG